MLSEKIDKAIAVINTVLAQAKNPALMCSFGKDSMVLLHILRSNNINLPVIFYTDPWFPKKYSFAHSLIAEWDLTVYDYPPIAVTMWEGESIMAFTNHYQIGDISKGGILQLPKNIIPPEDGKKWICGLNDILRRPTSGFNYPWDVVLVGHKDTDEDQIAGKVKLHCDVKKNNGIAPDVAFPIRHFTDSDIWEYTEKFGVPQQWDRYDRETKKENPDKETNSDYANVCISCIDIRKKGQFVKCPKLNNLVVTNMSESVPYHKPEFSYFGDKNAQNTGESCT